MQPTVQSFSRDLADRFVSQSRDLWDVACTLDESSSPVAEVYSRDATRYAVLAGYLRSRVVRDN